MRSWTNMKRLKQSDRMKYYQLESTACYLDQEMHHYYLGSKDYTID